MNATTILCLWALASLAIVILAITFAVLSVRIAVAYFKECKPCKP